MGWDFLKTSQGTCVPVSRDGPKLYQRYITNIIIELCYPVGPVISIIDT